MKYVLPVVGVIGVAGMTGLVLRSAGTTAAHPIELARLASSRGDFDSARTHLKSVIEAESATTPELRATANRARMELGYVEAKSGDFVAARKAFLEVPKPRPDEKPNSGFGTANDQATYQAIVCLVAQGKEVEATKEFRQFLKDRPTSALIVAVFKRLTRLSGGDPLPEDIKLFEEAQKAQEKFIRREMALCGPKSLAHLLEQAGAGEQDFRAIAKEVNTDDQGTTVNSLVKALVNRGCKAEAKELNAPDFRKLETPAIWFKGDHFVVIESFHQDQAKIFDPMNDAKASVALPDPKDGEFRAIVIQITLPKRDNWASSPRFSNPQNNPETLR